MRQPSTVAVVLALVLSATVARAGEIYCDSQGRNCSDRPGPDSIPIHVKSPPPGAMSEPAPAPGSAPRQPIDANANAQLKDASTRAAVDKDVAAKRTEDCKQARDKYQQSITAQRIYKLGKDGERIYLSDTELDQARLNARTQMDRSCGTSGN